MAQRTHTDKGQGMKRILVLMMVLGLVVGSIATAEAGKKKKKKPQRVERTAEAVYDAPALGSADTGGVCLGATNSCARIATGADDKFVRVEVKDAAGMPVAFTLGQDTDPDTLGTETKYGVFCGTTGDTPIAVEAAGVELLSFVWAFGGSKCPGAIATTGTVVATFSNLP